MNKIIKILTLFFCLLIFTSCTFIESRMDIFTLSEQNVSEVLFENILIQIEEQNKEGLKALFSDNAINDSENIDAEIECFFEYLQEEIIDWEVRTGPMTSYTYESGEKTEQINVWFDVETDLEYYVIFISFFPVDTKYPENEGIYSMRVVEKEYEETKMTYWQDMMIPGIYIPD